MSKGRIAPPQGPTPSRWIFDDTRDHALWQSGQAVLDKERRQIEAAAIAGYSRHGRGLVIIAVCTECGGCAADMRFMPQSDVPPNDSDGQGRVRSYDPAREVVAVLLFRTGETPRDIKAYANTYPRAMAAAA